MRLECTNIAWYCMDGLSVKKKFERKLLESLEKYGSTNFICIGTCNLLIANNTFGEEWQHWGKLETLANYQLNSTFSLTLSWQRPLSYRNQSIDLLCKSMDWFLYDNGLRHERVKIKIRGICESQFLRRYIILCAKCCLMFVLFFAFMYCLIYYSVLYRINHFSFNSSHNIISVFFWQEKSH